MDVFYEIVAGRYLKIMRAAASARSILLHCLSRRHQYRPVARTAGDLPSNNEGCSETRVSEQKNKGGKKKKSNFRHISPPPPPSPSLHPLRTCTSKQWRGCRVEGWRWGGGAGRQSQKPAWPGEEEGEKCRAASEKRGEILVREQPLVTRDISTSSQRPGQLHRGRGRGEEVLEVVPGCGSGVLWWRFKKRVSASFSP